MASTALTLETQAQALQLDLKEQIALFFESLPEITSTVAMSAALVEQSKLIKVSDSASYVTATEQVQALKAVEESFSELIDPFVDRAHKLHKTLTAIRKTYLDPGQSEQRRLKFEREQFAAEEERKRREAAQKAQQEALEREQARLIEEARLAASEGDSVAAEAILEEAVNVEAPPVQIPSTVPEVTGTSFRSVWEWVLGDRRKLKDEFLKVDEVAIGKIVRSMHKAAENLVGEAGAIQVIERKVVVDR